MPVSLSSDRDNVPRGDRAANRKHPTRRRLLRLDGLSDGVARAVERGRTDRLGRLDLAQHHGSRDRFDEGRRLTLIGAARWRDMVARVQNWQFAHGDLQRGNVLVAQSGQLRLVDFDGVWIPQLAGHAPPTEYGHPNYQRPGLHGWDRWLDTFSALVIYTSLVALSKDPGLWLALYNSKNLLFSRGDFFAPFDTQVWKQLAALRDPQLNELVRRLQECCDPDWVSNQSLEMTLDLQAVPPAQPPIPVELRWWEKQPVAPASPAGPAAEAPTQDRKSTRLN